MPERMLRKSLYEHVLLKYNKGEASASRILCRDEYA